MSSSSNSNIVQLQTDVQELFHKQEEMTRLKKQAKEINTQVKTLSDNIMTYLQTNGIGSCRAGEYCLSVETRKRLAALSAKDALTKAKLYFNIPEAKFADFLDYLTQEREENAKVTTTLSKKVAKEPKKKKALATPSPVLPDSTHISHAHARTTHDRDNRHDDDTTLSSAVQSIYS